MVTLFYGSPSGPPVNLWWVELTELLEYSESARERLCRKKEAQNQVCAGDPVSSAWREGTRSVGDDYDGQARAAVVRVYWHTYVRAPPWIGRQWLLVGWVLNGFVQADSVSRGLVIEEGRQKYRWNLEMEMSKCWLSSLCFHWAVKL